MQKKSDLREFVEKGKKLLQQYEVLAEVNH